MTSVTAQNTVGVADRLDLPGPLVDAQLEAVLEDLPVDGVKVGMLGCAAVARAVARRLQPLAGRIPVVLDPVVAAGSGDRLLAPEAEEILLEELFPLATVATPNLPEARVLARVEADAVELASRLADRGTAVLVKGGHATGDEVEDVLVTRKGIDRFRHPRLRRGKVHGTGCTLSSALAVRLARGEELRPAVAGAIAYVRAAIRTSVRLGAGQWVLTHPAEDRARARREDSDLAVASAVRP